jgi:hypothetical protein
VLPLVVDLILYVTLRAISVLGFIVGLATVLLSLGALSHWVWTELRYRPSCSFALTCSHKATSTYFVDPSFRSYSRR